MAHRNKKKEEKESGKGKGKKGKGGPEPFEKRERHAGRVHKLSGKGPTAEQLEEQQRKAWLMSLPEKEFKKEMKKEDRENRKNAKKRKKFYNREEDKEWQVFFDQFTEQLKAQGLRIKDVAGDGNCLFRSLADQILSDPELHFQVRTDVMTFIEQRREDFEPFVEDDEPFDKYVRSMKKNGRWGGHLEIQAASLLYSVNIHIYQLGMPRWDVSNFFGTASKNIQMSYHDGDHYNSVHHIDNWKAPVQTTPFVHGKKNEAPSAKQDKSSSKKASAIEESIIRATGCHDINMIREIYKEQGNDVDATISTLLFLVQNEYDEAGTEDPVAADPDPETTEQSEKQAEVVGEEKQDAGENPIDYGEELDPALITELLEGDDHQTGASEKGEKGEKPVSDWRKKLAQEEEEKKAKKAAETSSQPMSNKQRKEQVKYDKLLAKRDRKREKAQERQRAEGNPTSSSSTTTAVPQPEIPVAAFQTLSI